MSLEIIGANHPSIGRSWTTRLAEFLLEQLGDHHVFMDVNIIREAWILRRIAMRQHWEGQ